jgi:uncharacterized protein YqgC (DUF456 family)
MPIQTAKASMGYAKGHVTANLSLWIAIVAAITAVAGFFVWQYGGASRWGDLMALGGIILGILIIMKSHEGYAEPPPAATGNQPQPQP